METKHQIEAACEQERCGREAGEIVARSERQADVSETIADFEDGPEPGEPARAPALRTDPGQPAPQAEQDKGGVGDGESAGAVDAEPLGHEAGGQEHVIETEEILLDRMRGLGEDEKEEGPAEAVSAGLAYVPRSGWRNVSRYRAFPAARGNVVSIAGRPTGWVGALGMRCSSVVSQAVLAPM